MTTNHDHLREVAERATPGPWSLPHFAQPDVNCPCGYVLTDDYMGAICTVHASGEGDDWEYHGDNPRFEEAVANAVFIHTFQPATVKSLLNELAALRKENEGLRVDADTVRSAMNELIDNWRELSDAAYRDGYIGRREIWADAARTLWTRLAEIDAARAAIGDSHENH